MSIDPSILSKWCPDEPGISWKFEYEIEFPEGGLGISDLEASLVDVVVKAFLITQM